MQSTFPLLSQIQTPHDLRAMPKSTLPQVAEELRQFLIQTLNQCGGHFGANLGVVELTIALHYIFDTPEDRLVWDVGHQAYAHKVLTGRRDLLHTIRKTDGLAPFPTRSESAYDAFGVGHSSTAISAALGMAIAAQAQNNPRQAVAIIGDGGLTGGMAFEALNHAGALDANLLVVLNDNKMSISENVGALTHYLARILSGKVYSHLREGGKKILSNVPTIKAFAKRTETHMKGMVTPGTLFEELGFHYFGPIDGHDLEVLLPTLQNLKSLKGPHLLHVITSKGKGYSLAEADPIEYHAVKPGFLELTSKPVSSHSPTYSEVFGSWLCDEAARNSKLMAITPAMCEGSGMVEFAKQYPDRYFDVGIAEQHALTLAAGMACEGLKPVVAIYSTFLQRGYDQLIHDIALQNLDVTLAVDRAGIVGGDGATHHGYFDLSYLRHVPNLVIFAPADENECRQMLHTAYLHPGPAVVRYPRGKGGGIAVDPALQILPIGKAEIKSCHSDKNPSKKIALLAFGSMVSRAVKVAETLAATVVSMRYVKPLDEEMIAKMAESHDVLVTLEENTVAGGAGSAVNEWLMAHHYKIPVLNLGLPDRFIDQGDPDVLLAECGLDVEGILSTMRAWLDGVL